MQLIVKTLVNNKWEEMPIPDAFSEKIAFLKSTAGTPTIIKLTLSYGVVFYCGTEELVVQMRNQYPKAIVQTAEEAHKMIEHDPVIYSYTIWRLVTPKDVKTIFPDKPEKGWVNPNEQASS